MSEGAPKEKKSSAPLKSRGELPTQDPTTMSDSSSSSNQPSSTVAASPAQFPGAAETSADGKTESAAQTAPDVALPKKNGKRNVAASESLSIEVKPVIEINGEPLEVEVVPVESIKRQPKPGLPSEDEADAMLERLDAMAAKLEAIAAAKSAAEPTVVLTATEKAAAPLPRPQSDQPHEQLDLPAKLDALAAKLDALPAKLDTSARPAQAERSDVAPLATPTSAITAVPSQTTPAPPAEHRGKAGKAPSSPTPAKAGQSTSKAVKSSAPAQSAATARSASPVTPTKSVKEPQPPTPSTIDSKSSAQPPAITSESKSAPSATPSHIAAKPPANIPAKTPASSASAAVSAYDPDLADQAVKAKNLLTDQHFIKVSKTLMRFSLECCAEKVLTAKGETEVETRQRSAARLRQALVDLGPTFIKLGQFLSVRRDCLSVEMADELALLQDKVPPFPFELVRKTIISELGAPPEKIFQSFDETPIASASIGQVHTAVLSDGRPVVVKVQRPDLARRFYQDLGCMRLLAKMGLLIKPEGPWQSWIELSDEFGRNLFQEINYLQEGRNADRVRTMLKEQPEIQIPRVYWKYTGRRVLTLEYLPGTKIDQVKELEAKGYDLGKLGNQLVSSYLEMVLMHGFFHADPHAGNLCVGPDGRIIIYDFGMMGEITDAQREGITGCIAAVIKRDTQELVQHLKDLGIVKSDAELALIVRTVQPFIDYYAGKELKDLDFTDLEHDIDQIALGRALALPPTLAYLLRAGTSLEGIARTLKPNFSFVEAAKPPLKRWLMSKPQQASSLVKIFINGNFAIGRDVILKLANGKSSESQTKSTKSDKPGKLSQAKPTASPATPPAVNHEELTELRSRILMLENQLKFQANQRYILGAMAVWMVFSTVAAFLPQTVPYATYFLIGNGVMGAIIMWHLVTYLRPDKSPTKKGSSRGQRR